MEPLAVMSKFFPCCIVWILMMNADLTVKPRPPIPRLLMSYCRAQVDWEGSLRQQRLC